MDSYNFLPSHNIKLESTCETGHVHSFAKEMATEVKVFDMVDSKPPVSFKTKHPDVDVAYPGQDKKTATCSQIAPSLPMREHSQMEMMVYGDMDYMFMKQELSDVLCEDKSQRFGKMLGMMNCSSDLKMSGQNNELKRVDRIESRIIQNCHETLQEHENCCHISENVSSMSGVNTKDSLTDKNCQLQTNFGKKILNNAYTSDLDCHSPVTQADQLKTHKRTHTGERPYKCDACGASFTQAGILKKHKRTHTGERPYKCDACGASFTQASNLKAHKRTHTGERPYKCDACGAAFTEAGSLKIHKRTHTGERPYKCNACGAAFTHAGNLKTHKRAHAGERPYKCNACGASFTQANNLKTHKRTHTGERPYKCDACG
ncbi:hypothetical protein BsWGS_22307 [Bradybaena similaris]